MLLTVVADQCGADRLGWRMAPDITKGRQNIRIAFTRDNRPNDLHAGRAGDVRDNVMELQVHLHQSLLHMLDVSGCVFNETLALTQIGAQLRDLAVGSEAATQKAISVQLPQPTRVTDIGLAPRHVLCVTRIDQNDMEPMLLKNLVSRNPVNPGGFHRHTGDAAGCKPFRKLVKILRESSK